MLLVQGPANWIWRFLIPLSNVYGGSCPSWGDPDPRVLTCVAIVSQSPQAWRCTGVAL